LIYLKDDEAKKKYGLYSILSPDTGAPEPVEPVRPQPRNDEL